MVSVDSLTLIDGQTSPNEERTMALTRAAAGGGDFGEIKEALIGLAKKEAKVVFKVVQLHDEEEMPNGKVQPVTADMIVCSGPYKGKVLLDYRHIGRGITGPLRRAMQDGNNEVAGRLECKKTGATEWVAIQTPNDDDFDLIANFYGDGSKVWRGAEPLVAGDSSGGGASNGLAKVGGGSADDSEPPF